jgi:NAD(P)-dependent dehydrogenase (short-subunit alcohol dehydrogenase family)
MMTKAMAAELGPSSLRVNGLAPGYFHTDLNEALGEEPRVLGLASQQNPARQMGGNG